MYHLCLPIVFNRVMHSALYLVQVNNFSKQALCHPPAGAFHLQEVSGQDEYGLRM